MKKALIVGGAGFIGSHLADKLLNLGHAVRILDNLDPQVHGDDAIRPAYLNLDAELLVADVRDSLAVERALANIDVVFHLAAAVGVGQSMYEIARYSSVNSLGTAVLMEALIRRPVEKLIVASSMSIYGEGAYVDQQNRLIPSVRRDIARMERRLWEPIKDEGEALLPISTPESKLPDPSSVYALLKFHQERTCLCVGEAYKIPTVALRFFNVFGPRQALSNPYTGVIAIFAARLLNDQPPMIYEDGRQMRDFVSVHDVSEACLLAMQSPRACGGVFNIGSGTVCTVGDLAIRIATILGRDGHQMQPTGKYRVGDIRHCFADVSRAAAILNYKPTVTLDSGLVELAEWLSGQLPIDRVAQAGSELADRGLAL